MNLDKTLQDVCADIGMYVAQETDREIRKRVEEIEGKYLSDDEILKHLTKPIWKDQPSEVTIYAWKGTPIVKIDSRTFFRFTSGRIEYNA